MRIISLYPAAYFVLFGLVGAKASVEIPFESHAGMIWVQIQSKEDKALHFLVDSGAGISVIDLGVARRLGFRLGNRSVVQGVGYRASAHTIGDFDGSVSGLKLPAKLLAFDLSAVSHACGRQVDGLIGMDFFRKRIVQIDFGNRKVRVLSRGELPKQIGDCLPLAVRRDSLCVAVKVADQRPEWVRVDTGCRSALEWVANPVNARRLGVAVAVNSKIQRATLLDVQLGSQRLKGVRVGLHRRRIFPGESGLLGNGLLSKFLVTFDVEKRVLFLK